MKIAIVGPAHPYKGGIVQQTIELAHRLENEKHDVLLVAWSSQYPTKLYPGTLLPADQPEVVPYPKTERILSWVNPLTWRRAGKRLQNYDLVIFIWWFPSLQAPIYRAIKYWMGGVRTAVICHNVLPHESRPGDKQLASSFLKRIDTIIVHTPAQAATAARLTNNRQAKSKIITTSLPPLLPGWTPASAVHSQTLHRNLLFFGIVRDYKGLDILLKALSLTQNITLTIAGEFWGGDQAYRKLITSLGLSSRVTIRSGYTPAQDIPALFASCDALVLPYRSATGTTNVQVGFGYNVPVIASNIPTLASQIQDGSDGILFENEQPKSLAASIDHLYRPGVLEHLRAHVPTVPVDAEWETYTTALLSSASSDSR